MVPRPHLSLLVLASLLAACGGSGPSSDEPPGPPPPPPGEIQQQQIEVGEWLFDLRVTGPTDGTPVILLHGFPQTSIEWRAQLKALGEAGYRAVAPNQRGYSPGARPAEQSAYSSDKLAEDVIGMADALGFGLFHLVGHDWGAAVAWLLGSLHPERLLSLNPISVPHLDAFEEVRSDPESCQSSASSYFNFFVQPSFHEVMLANDAQFLRGFYAGLPEEHVEDYLAVLTEPGALKAALDWYRANLAGDRLGPEIGPIELPTMYIWSTGDEALCRDGAVLTGDHIEGPYRFEIIEEVNHWVPEMAAEQVSALLLEHFAEQAATP